MDYQGLRSQVKKLQEDFRFSESNATIYPPGACLLSQNVCARHLPDVCVFVTHAAVELTRALLVLTPGTATSLLFDTRLAAECLAAVRVAAVLPCVCSHALPGLLLCRHAN